MSVTADPLPDLKLAAITWIRGHTDLPATVTVAGATIDTLQDVVTNTGPYVAVYRPPGGQPGFWAYTDTCMINVQVWAVTESDARDTGALIHAILHTAPGNTAAGVWIASVDDVTGLGEAHDPGVPDLYRQILTVRMSGHAA